MAELCHSGAGSIFLATALCLDQLTPWEEVRGLRRRFPSFSFSVVRTFSCYLTQLGVSRKDFPTRGFKMLSPTPCKSTCKTIIWAAGNTSLSYFTFRYALLLPTVDKDKTWVRPYGVRNIYIGIQRWGKCLIKESLLPPTPFCKWIQDRPLCSDKLLWCMFSFIW